MALPGGGMFAMTWRGIAAVWRRRQEGAKTPSGFLIPLLTPPHLPSDATPFGRASKMRGAHRGVWCSKGQRLIEAELFAAPIQRPALSGRALLCAAVYAREIQGNKASHKLKDARNRAPVSPV